MPVNTPRFGSRVVPCGKTLAQKMVPPRPESPGVNADSSDSDDTDEEDGDDSAPSQGDSPMAERPSCGDQNADDEPPVHRTRPVLLAHMPALAPGGERRTVFVTIKPPQIDPYLVEARDHLESAAITPASSAALPESMPSSDGDHSLRLTRDLGNQSDATTSDSDSDAEALLPPTPAANLSNGDTVVEEINPADGRLLATHENSVLAAHALGRKSDRRIREALQGHRATAHGRRWSSRSVGPPSPLRRFPSRMSSEVDFSTPGSERVLTAMIAPMSPPPSGRARKRYPASHAPQSGDPTPSSAGPSMPPPPDLWDERDFPPLRSRPKALRPESAQHLRISQRSPVTNQVVRAWASWKAAAESLKLNPSTYRAHLMPRHTGQITNVDGRLLCRGPPISADASGGLFELTSLREKG